MVGGNQALVYVFCPPSPSPLFSRRGQSPCVCVFVVSLRRVAHRIFASSHSWEASIFFILYIHTHSLITYCTVPHLTFCFAIQLHSREGGRGLVECVDLYVHSTVQDADSLRLFQKVKMRRYYKAKRGDGEQ